MPDAAPHTPSDAEDVLARARRTRVVVVGGGAAGLVAALEWAKIGAAVTVLEASGRLGGGIETVELDGLPVDLVADAFSQTAPRLNALIDDLALRDAVEPAARQPVWVAGRGGAGPLPAAALLGIPANPWADDVRRLIGWRGSWRAYLDRLRPPLTIGHERSLGRLARSRMGDRVADRLVAPVTRGLYGLDPDEVDLEVAAPELNPALTRTGSLAGAVGALLPDDPGAPVRATVRGGMGRLVDALAERLVLLGADLRVDAPVVALVEAPVIEPPAADARWSVEIADAGDDPAPVADVVVVATGARAAAALLADAGVDREAVEPVGVTGRDVVSLVLDAPALDAAPRGRVVYPLAPPSDPSDPSAGDEAEILSVTQATADWTWLAEAAGPGRHVLRVVLGPGAVRGEIGRAHV